MIKVCVYARYSSDSQTEQSIDGQLRVCKEFCEKNNYVIVKEYIDRAMTGTNDKRPAFQQMLKDSKNHDWEKVIVYKLDRFSRSRQDSAINRAILLKNGVKLVSATEIQVQGLELDYTCLLWDADMRYDNGKWRFYKFNGQTKWVEQIPNTENKKELVKYMLNAYRVLLTRARAGMVICVPKGNSNKNLSGFWEDSTRLPEYYNGTYEYLKSIEIEEID